MECTLAFITNITPSLPNAGEDIVFNGSGDDDGTIIQYSWFSSLDDDLYYGPSRNFTRNDLSTGIHTISLRVKDNHGAWSDPVSVELKINSPPTSRIQSQSHFYAVSGDTIMVNGSSSDNDGSVEEYQWILTGPDQIERYRCETPHMVFDPQNIPDVESWFLPGNFTISYRVCDDNGLWSSPTSTFLVVHEPPTARMDVKPGQGFPTDSAVQINGSVNDEEPIEVVDHHWSVRKNGTSMEWCGNSRG